jgi:hypothetical protein
MLFFVILILGCKVLEKKDEVINDNQRNGKNAVGTISEITIDDIENSTTEYNWFTGPPYTIDPLGKRETINGSPPERDIYRIKNFPSITSLSLHVVDIDKIDFSPLYELVNLHSLYINCYDDSFVDFPDLSGIKNLKELEILGASIYSFQNIREKLPDIEYFRISPKDTWGIQISDFGNISKISSIKKIFLQFQSDFDIKLSDFYGLPNLKYIKTFTTGTIDFKGSENLTSLEYLEAADCSPKNVRYASNLNSLQELHLKIDKSITDLAFLSGLTKLKKLSLQTDNFNRGAGPREGLKDYQVRINVQPLASLINLEYLSFSGFIIENIFALSELPINYRSIYACDCFFLPDDDIYQLSEGGNFLVRNFIPDGK